LTATLEEVTSDFDVSMTVENAAKVLATLSNQLIETHKVQFDTGVFGNVIVVNWSCWTTFAHIFEVLNQIFFNSWLVEQVWQESDAVNANFLGMFAQIVYISDVASTDAENHLDTVFAAHFKPFFSQTFAFNAQGSI
jgi:hypothetical protein